jgi:hypothetical protein
VSEGLRFPREPASLCVGESNSLSAELVTENSVTRKLRFLLLEILDHFLLVAAQPAGEKKDQELQRQRCHREMRARPGRARIGGKRRSHGTLNLLNLLEKLVA